MIPCIARQVKTCRLSEHLTNSYAQGSTTFMALELMYDAQSSGHMLSMPPHWAHKSYHDLESFLYVLVIICILFQGPGQHCPMEELEGSILKSWWMPSSYCVAADFKASAFTCGLPSFKQHITSHFTLYFQPLITPITDLFHLIFGGMTMDDPVSGPTAFNFQVVNPFPVRYEGMLEKMGHVLEVTRMADQADVSIGKAILPSSLVDSEEPLVNSVSDTASTYQSTLSFPPSTVDPLSTSSYPSVRSSCLVTDSPECYGLRLELTDELTSTTPSLPMIDSPCIQYTPVIHLPIGISFKLFTPSTDIPPPVYPDLIPRPLLINGGSSDSGRASKRARTSGSGRGKVTSLAGRSKRRSITSSKSHNWSTQEGTSGVWDPSTILAFSQHDALGGNPTF